MNRSTRNAITCSIVAAWMLGISFGAKALWKHSSEPGSVGEVPDAWPAGVEVRRPDGKPLLLFFAHPQCPCTRASVAELARIMARSDVEARVYMYQPADAPEGWADSPTWKSASEIPGVQVGPDLDGRLSKAFGAETSGHAVVYDAAGRLLFSGGITASRGHEGGNAGSDAILALANQRAASTRSTPTYGCGIFSSPTRP